jgi:hypothetical protein
VGDFPPNEQLEKPKWRYRRAILGAHGLSLRTAFARLVNRIRLPVDRSCPGGLCGRRGKGPLSGSGMKTAFDPKRACSWNARYWEEN